MMKLLLSIGIYYLIEAIGLCDALPIPAVPIGERNMFLLGAFAFMTFGAVLAGCVCCRRRKKGFEPNKEKDPKEFTNESGTLDNQNVNQRIENSISSRIISLENQRQHGVPSIAITEATASSDTTRSTTPAAIVVSIPVVNNSNENLIVDNNDNNNGPISPADLENIENNNAFDYIQNQNEICITVEHPPSSSTIPTTSRNQNLYSINEITRPTSTQNEIKMENVQYENENIENNNNINNNNNNDNNNHQQDMPNNDIKNQAQLNHTQDIVITSTTNDINESKLYNPNEISNENNSNMTVILSAENNNKNIIEEYLHTNTIINAEIHSIDEKSNKLNQEHNHQKINIINNEEEYYFNNKIVEENVAIVIKCENEKDGNNLNDNDIKYNNLNEIDLKPVEYSTLLLSERNKGPKNEDILISEVLLAGLEDTGSDSISIKSISSDKSHDIEVSSVEEALRALDIAIEGGLDDDNDDIIENDDKVNFVVINSNETVTEYENNSKTTEIIKVIENDDYNNHIKNVRIEAEELVDSVLNDRKKIIELEAIEFVDSLLKESKKIIEDKKQQEECDKKTENEELDSELEENINQLLPLSLPTSPQPPSSTQTIAVNYFTIETNNICPNDILLNCAHDFDEMMLMKQKQKIQKQQQQQQQPKTEFNTNTPINFKQKLAEQFDDFFGNGMIASSTPSVQNKFTKINENNIKKCGIKLKFNDNENLISPTTDLNTTLSPVNDISSEMLKQNITYKAADATNNATDVTYNAADATYNAADATYNAEANKTYNAATDATYNAENNETFDVNKTYDGDPIIKDDFTYPGDPCTSKQAMERDQFLRPLIKYQREEVTSDEMNTITPVNTPIELNYNQETWNKMTKPNDDESKNGWFLHPQQFTSSDNGCFGDGGNGTQLENNSNYEYNGNPDETYEIDEEDSRNLESTFEALRKQLAEVLPQPQGMAGPPEFSDDDDDQHSTRTFDEYRSPLDGIFGLLEIDNTTPTATAQNNEVVINYNNKRPLSPIIEESEEETCKTFVLNETKCLDSTSTGCIETGEAIMGVTKTLMASNDTLFNFEDTLGDKEDVFSPRVSSRSDSQATTPVKTSGKSSSTANSSVATTISSSDTEKVDNQNDLTYIHSTISNLPIQQQIQQREPPKTLNFIDINELKSDNDFCSPDQQKTFSEGTTSTSTTTDRLSSSLSPTFDNETTYTLNTIDDKTCITVIIKDDERISEISEPEWDGSTTSCGNIGGIGGAIVGTGYDMNSLTDIPSLDFNVNTFDKEFEISENLNDIDDEIKIQNKTNDDENKFGERKTTSLDDDENTDNGNDEIAIDEDIEIQQKDSGHDDSGHSTQASTDKSNNTSHNISAQETDSIVDEINQENQYNQVLEFNNSPNNILNISKNINDIIPATTTIDKKENCKEFLKNEIKFSSNLENRSQINNDILNDIDDGDDNKKSSNIVDDSLKENSDPNVVTTKTLNNGTNTNNVVVNTGFDEKITSYQKVVQMNNSSQDNVINDKSNNISTSEFFDKEHYSINGSGNGMDFYQEKAKPDVIVTQVEYNNKLETKQQEQITPSSSPLLLNSSRTNNYDNCCGSSSNVEIIGHLSGEEDPWADTLNEIRFTGPRSADIISNSSEWDSDIDDSHSSEEFMYMRGDGVKSTDDTILKYIKHDEENSSDIANQYNNDENNLCQNENLTIDNNTIQFDKNVEENFKSNLWSSHRDKIPVGVVKESNGEEDAASEGGSLSELEGEFIPSCWDSMAMPARSALKSPDKTNSSSDEDSQGDNKKCRSVVFKKQRYHSVYEYPRENTSLSPSFSGSNIWQNKNYVFKNYANENTIEKFNDDGFVISSSSRPFHGSQFNALCHTWPTDSDFSWSKIESHEKYGGNEKKLTTYSEIDLKWPKQPLINDIDVKDVTKSESDDNHRPDSGVGESAEMLSDRQSLGELCHTKTKLRLPIEEKLVLPTSSCTGSMDSLSSSSSINSELQQQINQQEQDNHQPEKPKLNFSTFGKRNTFTATNDNEKRSTNDNNSSCFSIKQNSFEFKNDKINRPAINIILIDEKINNTKLIQNNCSEIFSNNSNNLIMKTDKIKQSDSTDEDSGIESIMRINKID